MSSKSEPTRLRLFIALWPPERLQNRFAELSAGTIREGGGVAVPAGNLHVTLAFLGATPVKLLDAVREAAAAVRAEPFDLNFDRIESWARQRLLCAVPSVSAPALDALAVAVGNALEGRGFERERRRFRPHLTLARKLRGRVPARTIDAPVWPVDSLALVSSVTDPAGSIYTVLERWRFA